MLSLHGAVTTVPNSNEKLLLGLLIVSEEIWAEGFGIVLRANPAEFLYENIGLGGFPYIIESQQRNC